jgi:hypothetical protein
MSFPDALARLKKAASVEPGSSSEDTRTVSVADLRQLLYHFDRLDRAERARSEGQP